MYDNSPRSMLRGPRTLSPLTARLKTRSEVPRYRDHKPSLLISNRSPLSWMKSESNPLTSPCAVTKLPSNGDYVLRLRLGMFSSWTASASLKSMRTGKFNRTESGLIRLIFCRNCSSKHTDRRCSECSMHRRSVFTGSREQACHWAREPE